MLAAGSRGLGMQSGKPLRTTTRTGLPARARARTALQECRQRMKQHQARPDQECEPDDRQALVTDQRPLRDLISTTDQLRREPCQYADTCADQSGAELD